MFVLYAFLQEAQQADFWPDTSSEWMGFIVAGATIVGLIIGLFRQAYKLGQAQQKQATDHEAVVKRQEADYKELLAEMNRRFTAQGERIGNISESCTGHTKSMEALENDKLSLNLETSTNSREIARVAGELTQLQNAFTTAMRDSSDKEGYYRERIAVIETTVGLKGSPPPRSML